MHKTLFFLIEVVFEDSFLHGEMELSEKFTHYVVNIPDGRGLVACSETPNEGEAKVVVQFFKPYLLFVMDGYSLLAAEQKVLEEVADAANNLDRDCGHGLLILNMRLELRPAFLKVEREHLLQGCG